MKSVGAKTMPNKLMTFWRHSVFVGRVVKILWGELIEHFEEVFTGFPASHGQVVEHIVSAVMRICARDIAIEFGDERESFFHQVDDICRLEVALNEQIVARTASHRTPINNFIAPDGVISQESGSQMFDGVKSTVPHGRFSVRLFHTDVESSYYVAAGQEVFA